MVDALVHRGYVAPAEAGEGFELTNKLFALGMTRAPARSLLEHALPEMRKLSRVIGQSCHLAVASEDQMVVVARIEAPYNQGFSVRVGYRRPLLGSTSGLVLYAFQPESVRAEWRKQLSRTVMQKAWKEFEERAAAARSQKFVRADSDVARHVVGLSAPIIGIDEVAAALTCPFFETPMAIPIRDTIAAIRQTAEAISQKIKKVQAHRSVEAIDELFPLGDSCACSDHPADEPVCGELSITQPQDRDRKADDAPSELIHHHHHSVRLEDQRFTTKEIDAPETVLGYPGKVGQDGPSEPRIDRRCLARPRRTTSLIDIETEHERDLSSNMSAR
jgi:DNA-binding IclR family transcriptional regulator